MNELEGLRDAIKDVFVPDQRVNIERDGNQIVLNVSNVRTLRGIRIGPCSGCHHCESTDVEHLQFTPYNLVRNR